MYNLINLELIIDHQLCLQQPLKTILLWLLPLKKQCFNLKMSFVRPSLLLSSTIHSQCSRYATGTSTKQRQSKAQRHFLPRFIRRFFYRYPMATTWAFGIFGANLLLSRLWYDAYQIYQKGWEAYRQELGGDHMFEREKSKWKYGEHLTVPFSTQPLVLDTPEDIEWRKKRDYRIQEERLEEMFGENWREKTPLRPKSTPDKQ